MRVNILAFDVLTWHPDRFGLPGARDGLTSGRLALGVPSLPIETRLDSVRGSLAGQLEVTASDPACSR